jgi:hypothetical protein
MMLRVALNPLKRIISIFFLFIFLFQVGGYYIVFWGMQYHAKTSLLERLDAGNYSQDEVIVLSIPLSLPYPIFADGYQRTEGDFQYEGDAYKLVKQKLENDTLFVVCIKDKETTKIATALSDVTKFTHNLPVNNKKAVNFIAKLYKDFRSTEFKILYKSRLMYERSYFAEANSSTLTQPFTVDSPPPELVF